MPIIEDKSTNIITTQGSDVVLDPDSMVDGAPLKANPAELFKKLDALIEDVEKDKAKFKAPRETNSDILYCELHLRNKVDKKFKLHGPVQGLEVSLPHRLTVCVQVPDAVISYFLKFCMDSCLGSTRNNKVLLEHCETFALKKKTVLVAKNAKGRRRNYLQLDFFKVKKISNGNKMALDLEFMFI